MQTVTQQFEVPFQYPVHFTNHVFDAGNVLLRDVMVQDTQRPSRALVFVDGGLADACPSLPQSITHWFAAMDPDQVELVKPPHCVPGGEAIKNDYRLTMEIVDTILEYRLCRHSYVIAIGGGAVLDAVGFAASIVHRGLRTIRLPSTTLAQNDAGIGVKNGMNLHGGKNTIGTFHPPYAVINDFDLLDSLPPIHWIGGISEAFKVALIKDAAFFEELCTNAPRYRNRDRRAQEQMIIRCAELHLDHIRSQGDPFELGHARPLDFGHWAAHKLEAMSGYAISHGDAVATGIVIDSIYANLQGWLEPEAVDRLCQAIQQIGFTLWHPIANRRLGDGTYEILNGLDDFREHLGGELCVTFPNGLGQRREEHEIDLPTMIQALEQVRALSLDGPDRASLSVSSRTAGRSRSAQPFPPYNKPV